MRIAALAALALLIATPAFAEDEKVCSEFNWPVDRELALLKTAKDTRSGATLIGPAPHAINLWLSTGVTLPAPSEKPTDPAKFAGYVTVAAPAPGEYLVSLSGEAWIDVVQDGVPVKSTLRSGDPNCPGLRKSVRFTLTNKPVTLQVSNGPENRILLAITPWYAKH